MVEIAFAGRELEELALPHEVGVDLFTGASTLSIPLAAPNGRGDFGPALSLLYRAGAGSSPFGMGMTLAGLPSIGVDARRSIPRYDGSDGFVLDGRVELVPELSAGQPRTFAAIGHTVRCFRTRTSGADVRFEQWIDNLTGAYHWRTRDARDVLTIYGTNERSRIFDPRDDRRIFLWLPERQIDPDGNLIELEYANENSDGVDFSQSFEHARLGQRFAQRYIKRIRYGNTHPAGPFGATVPENRFCFELVFDYGDHSGRDAPAIDPDVAWSVRIDPFSSYRPGFEVRTYRLCRRILCFHRFAELGAGATLVGVTALEHREHAAGSALERVRYTGHRRGGERRSLPPLALTYAPHATAPAFFPAETDVFDSAAQPLTGDHQLVDLYGEGLAGILSETDRAWFYRPNEGGGRFGAMVAVAEKPATRRGGFVFADLDRDGDPDLALMATRQAGRYELDRDLGVWRSFRPFEALPHLEALGGKAQWVDLNGDGLADLVVALEDRFVWFPSREDQNFDAPVELARPIGAGAVPSTGEDRALDFFFADMNGDGVIDLVRVRNGSVEYWPHSGHGRFGEGIVLEGAANFAPDHEFDPTRLRLVDLDGSGTADLIYLGRGEARIFRNAAGNSLIDGGRVDGLPYFDSVSNVRVADFLGDGRACLVWSSVLPTRARALEYLPLTPSERPLLLLGTNNGLGLEVRLEYRSSSADYLRDRNENRPWQTKLPHHFPVVSRKETHDHIAGTASVTRYVYHDGFFDSAQREQRGFGQVDVFDTSAPDPTTSDTAFSAPSLTRSWFHLGTAMWRWPDAVDVYALDPALSPIAPHVIEDQGSFAPGEIEEALAVLAGKLIRREVYALTGSRPVAHPLIIHETQHGVRRVQAGAFSAYEAQSLEHVLEGEGGDPRTSQSIALVIDSYNRVTRIAELAYPRRATVAHDAAAQTELRIQIEEVRLVHVDQPDHRSLAIPIERRRLELGGLGASDLESPAVLAALANPIFHDAAPPDPALGPWARLLEIDRNYYWNDAFDAPLPLGEVGARELLHHSESACFTPSFLSAMLGPVDAIAAGYRLADGLYWQSDPTQYYFGPDRFRAMERVERADGARTVHIYDPYTLVLTGLENAFGDRKVAELDYHLVAPWRITGANGDVEEVEYDPLGVIRVSTFYGRMLDAGGAPADHGHDPLAARAAVYAASIEEVIADPDRFLQTSSSIVAYELREGQPPAAVIATREDLTHDATGLALTAHRTSVAVQYLDGFGRTIQTKTRVDGDRWLASAHVVYDEKQRPGRTYEPYFATDWRFDSDPQLRTHGVATQILYDAAGREIERLFPDGTLERTQYRAWSITALDANDLVEEGTYRLGRELLPSGAPERQALEHSRTHANTPATRFLDPSGREIATFAAGGATAADQRTEVLLDARGEARTAIDARGIVAFRQQSDMVGRVFRSESADAGTALTLYDAFDRARTVWDARGYRHDFDFDLLDRLISTHVSGNGLDHRVEERRYGESLPADEARLRCLRGRLIELRDEAGLIEIAYVDPRGQAARSSRRLRVETRVPPDWQNAVALEETRFETRVRFDALGRVIEERGPDGLIRRTEYLRGGGIASVRVSSPDGSFPERTIVSRAEYDAHGARTRMRLGEAVEVGATYDPNTSRLSALAAHRLPRTAGGPLRTIQDLRYTYDASGLIVGITDLVQEPTFSTPILIGLNVSARREYRYDSHRRLIRATGRVHQALLPHDYRPGVPGALAGTRHIRLDNAAAVERYTRTYTYDRSGNLTRIHHAGATRTFATDVWISASSNRGVPAFEPDGTPVISPETEFDAAGDTLRLAHLRSLEWSWHGAPSRAVVIARGGDQPDDAEHYVYGADGLRVRKISERLTAGGLEVSEKIVLGGSELFRTRLAGVPRLERWSSQIYAGDERVATIHRWVRDDVARETDDIQVPRIIFALSDHQGSSVIELDENGDLITYEEYFPYGGSSFVAGNRERDVNLKDYRYTGKERDAATGLYYFGHRYYVPWIGRWLSPDPAGPTDDLNLYQFVLGDPVGNVDPDGLATETSQRATGSGQVLGTHTASQLPPEVPRDIPIPPGQYLGWNDQKSAWETHTIKSWRAIKKRAGLDIVVVEVDPRALAAEQAEDFLRFVKETLADANLAAPPGASGEGNGPSAKGTGTGPAGDAGLGSGTGGEDERAVDPGGDGGAGTGDHEGEGPGAGALAAGNGATGASGLSGADELAPELAAGGGEAASGTDARGAGEASGGADGEHRGAGEDSSAEGTRDGFRDGTELSGASDDGRSGTGRKTNVDNTDRASGTGTETGGMSDPSLDPTKEGAPSPPGLANDGTDANGTRDGEPSGNRTEPLEAGTRTVRGGAAYKESALDVLTRVAGYANFETGGPHPDGQRGGLPGGRGSINLGWFGQVAYIGATILSWIGPGALFKGLKFGLRFAMRGISAVLRGGLAIGRSALNAATRRVVAVVGALLRKTSGEVIDPLVDASLLIAAHKAVRGSTKAADIAALALLRNTSYKWVITPTAFKEFARIASGGASARRFIASLEKLGNTVVMSGAEARALAKSSIFDQVRKELVAVANKSSAGLGTRAGNATGKSFYNDIVQTAFAVASKIPWATRDRRFVNFIAAQASKYSTHILPF